MSTPKITLSATKAASEGGANGIFTITLDSPAPAGGLLVSYNTTGSSAASGDYSLIAGSNVSALTADSFVVAAGLTTAELQVQAKADGQVEAAETLALTLSAGAGGAVSFAAQKTFYVGNGSTSVSVGDVNGDGRLDVLTAIYDSDTVSLLLGDGQGGFTFQNFAVGDAPISVSVADFLGNGGNGRLDVLTANLISKDASLLVGDGQGGFALYTTLVVGTSPKLSVGDFNGDGRLDVLTVYNGINVSLLLDDGQGRYVKQKTFTVGDVGVGDNANSVSVGDVNGDGRLDVLTSSGLRDSVSLLLGDGQGGFATRKTFAVGDSPNSVSVGDVNGDGHLDVLATNGASDNVSLLLGDGQGGFATQQTFTVGDNPISVSVGDVNGDGRLDVLTANYKSDNVSLLLGDGQGGFATQQSFAVGTTPQSVRVGDVNGDGRLDVLTANYGSKNVSVLINQGDAEQSTNANLSLLDASNQVATGNVSINDTTPEQGQILSVSNTLADADGLGDISYAWLADGLPVSTGESYTVTANDLGKTLSVTASFTDGLGNAESVSSAATSAVQKPAVSASPGFNISPTGPQSTGEDGTVAIYSIALKTAPLPKQDVTLTFTSSDTSEGVLEQSKLVFTSSNWTSPQTLTVRGVDDDLDDNAQPYLVTVKVSTTDVFYKALTLAPLALSNADDGLDTPLDLYGDEGGSKIDVLVGGNGADKLHGLNKADDLAGGKGNDSLWGGYGDDNLRGDAGDDYLEGEQENDLLESGEGNDFLYGTGGGLDTLIGGPGNDTYYLDFDNLKDVITDNGLATDIDTVIMPFNLTRYTLPTGIEKGVIDKGNQASSLTGNRSDNDLTGNDGKNTLDGGLGRDSLFGGAGNDQLIGGLGRDSLFGGVGSDVLSGGADQDVFVFNTALKANVDRISDFKPVDDTIQLENAIFKALGAKTGVLASAAFNTGKVARDASDRILYDSKSGGVFYDDDGTGAHAAVQIAILGKNLALTNADFVVI